MAKEKVSVQWNVEYVKINRRSSFEALCYS